MYSRSEKSKIKKEFWTAFGSYMKPVSNVEGETINWTNYKTGVKHLFFRMDVDNKFAIISVEISNPADEERLERFHKFLADRNFIETIMQEPWIWEENYLEENGSQISKIYFVLKNVSIFNRNDWPLIISFLKQRMINLDAYWSTMKIKFECKIQP